MCNVYQQMELEESSRDLLMLNTHKGLNCLTRLAFGIKSATGIFQRAMENRLKGIPNTIVRVDDILVGGQDYEHKLINLCKVLTVIKESRLRLKWEKCTFMKDSVVYLGMKIDKEGISPVKEKNTAILEAPNPTNVSELRAFLGMLNYYLVNLSTVLEPLNILL